MPSRTVSFATKNMPERNFVGVLRRLTPRLKGVLRSETQKRKLYPIILMRSFFCYFLS